MSDKYIEKYVFRTYNDVRKLLLYILLKDTACRYRKGIIICRRIYGMEVSVKNKIFYT